MIRRCREEDFDRIHSIINDGAEAYRGVIPEDRWSEPYMSSDELREAIQDGVTFWGYEENGELLGVMGLEEVRDVTLIRHAYVSTSHQKRGIGALLLAHLRLLTERPILIGTWADAGWAIRFYQRYGFQVVSAEEKDRLLRTYWRIPERQIETSVVLKESRQRQREGK